MQRIRHMDSLQGFMNSFKQFEKKLDKLQSDVDFHGNTLSELRVLVANLSGAACAEKEKLQRRNVGCQYDNSYRTRRPEAIQPLPNKLRNKSLQNQKHGFSKTLQESFLQPKKVSMPAVTNKRHTRLKKSEAPRRSPTFRQQKILEKPKRYKRAIVHPPLAFRV